MSTKAQTESLAKLAESFGLESSVYLNDPEDNSTDWACKVVLPDGGNFEAVFYEDSDDYPFNCWIDGEDRTLESWWGETRPEVALREILGATE